MARSLLDRLEAEPIHTDKDNLHEIKVALDDAVVKFMLEEAGYTEDYFQMNIKLLVAFVMNVVGGATAYYARKTPFEYSKFWAAVGSGIFLVIYGLWNLYTLLAIQYVFTGKRDSGKGQLVRLRSSVQLNDPVYRLFLVRDDGEREILAKRVDNWITEDGFVAARPFISDMQSAVPKIENLKKD